MTETGERVGDGGRRRSADREPRGATATTSLKRPGLDADARAEARFQATADEFLVDLHLTVQADGEPFAERRWKRADPAGGRVSQLLAGRTAGWCSSATSASRCATASSSRQTSTDPTGEGRLRRRSSSTSPTARTICARSRTAARTSCWSRPASCACAWTCAAPAARRASPWTSTPRPSSWTGSRWSSGWPGSRGATATWARGASPTAASRASSSPHAGRRRCGRSRRCTPPTIATPTTCTTTAARWRRSSSATTRSA